MILVNHCLTWVLAFVGAHYLISAALDPLPIQLTGQYLATGIICVASSLLLALNVSYIRGMENDNAG